MKKLLIFFGLLASMDSFGQATLTTPKQDLPYSAYIKGDARTKEDLQVMGRAVIGDSVVNGNASLELDDEDKGFLPNRLTTAQMNAIVLPANGLTVYNIDSNAFCRYDSDDGWRKYAIGIVTGSTGPTGPTGPSGSNGSNGAAGATGATGATGPVDTLNFWHINGNSGTNPATNYIGCTDTNVLNVGLASGGSTFTAGRLDGNNANAAWGGLFNVVPNTGGVVNYGSENTAVGIASLSGCDSCNGNVGIGTYAGLGCTSCRNNVAIGGAALMANVSGMSNVSIGSNSLVNLITGSYNTIIGDSAGLNNTNGSGNVFLGSKAGSYGDRSNTLFINNKDDGDSITENRRALIWGTFGTDSSDQNVTINGTLRINDGSQSNGYVLTSDANGLASWQAPSAASYDKYVAILSQDGTPGNAPTAVVLENTLGGAVVWTYNATGNYIGTLAGAFPVDKVFFTSNGGGDFVVNNMSRDSNNTVTTHVGDYTSGAAVDGAVNITIEIRVYP